MLDVVSDGYVHVPMLQIKASAGAGRFKVPSDEAEGFVAFRSTWLRSIGCSPHRTEALCAMGDSMEPTIRDGDVMLVDRSIDHIVDNGIYVVVVGGAVVVKRVQTRFNGSVVLKSDNARYGEELIDPREARDLIVEGRVRWCGRTM